jgi:23S rRNA A1618 N6-methylase RlmF
MIKDSFNSKQAVPNNLFRDNKFARIMMISVICWSCNPETFNSADELKAFVTKPANHLTQKIATRDYEIQISFRPADLMIYQEIGGEPTDHQRLLHLEKKYQNSYYFVISLVKSSDTTSYHQQQARVSDLTGNISHFLKLTTSEYDTLGANAFSIEQTNTLSNPTEILFILKKEKSRDKKWIQFNLNELGRGFDDHAFKFHIHDLEAVPKLRFELIS